MTIISRIQKCFKQGGQDAPTTTKGTLAVFFGVWCFLAVLGGMCCNPTIGDWWSMGKMPPGEFTVDEYTQLYDRGYISMDIGDFLFGSIFMIMKDIVGVGVTIMAIGVSLAWAWSTTIINYGSIFYSDAQKIAAFNAKCYVYGMCTQGAVLNGISICIFFTASFPTFPKVFLPESMRFMFLNGGFDFAQLVAAIMMNIAYYNENKNSSGMEVARTQSSILILFSFAFSFYGLLFAPRDIRGNQEKALKKLKESEMAAKAMAASQECDQQCLEANAVPAVSPFQSFLHALKDFSNELCSVTILSMMVLWFSLAMTRGIMHGTALKTAVVRQFGEGSMMYKALNAGSWLGFITSMIFGCICQIDMGLGFLWIYFCQLGAVLGLGWESKWSVAIGIPLFLTMRGSVYGAAFYFTPRLLWNPIHEGKSVSFMTFIAGLTLLLTEDFRVNVSAVTVAKMQDGVMTTLLEKDYRPIIKVWGYVLLALTPLCLAFSFYLVPRRIKKKDGLVNF